jgi:SNF2 family DNA or RNA helicase
MNFNDVIHNYQRKAVKFMLENRYSGLFLDPGLGKTATSLLYIKLAKKYLKTRKALIIAPKRVCYITWPDEIAAWADLDDLTYTILHGKHKAANLKKDVDIYLINPEGLKWLTGQLKKNRVHDFDILIVDESTKFKNWQAKRTRMLLKMLRFFRRRHILTGTPSPNGLLDLFAQIFLIDMGKALGTGITKFREAYFTHDPYRFSYTINDGCDEIIHNKVAPLVLQMSAEDYLDLPELIPNPIYVELPNSARDIYEDLEKRLEAEIEDKTVNLVNGSAVYNACKQIASGGLYEQEDYFPTQVEKKKDREYYDIHNEKIDALEDLIEENGKQMLVAYAYNHDLERLQQRFPGVPHIGRGVSDDDAMELVKRWNKGKEPLIFCQPSSMAHGLNMQKRGGDICWFSLTDNLEDHDQFIRRIHRQGVPGDVTNHYIMAKRTVDEAIYARLLRKGAAQDSLRSAIKQYMVEKNI